MGWNRFNLTLLGVWPEPRKISNRSHRISTLIFWSTTFVTFTFICAPQTAHLILKSTSLDEVIENLSINVPIVFALVKQIVLRYHKEGNYSRLRSDLLEFTHISINLRICSPDTVAQRNIRRLVGTDTRTRSPNDAEDRENKPNDIHCLLYSDILDAICIPIAADLEQHAKHVGKWLGGVASSRHFPLRHRQEPELRGHVAGTAYGDGADSDLLLLLRHVSRGSRLTFMRPINCSQSGTRESGLRGRREQCRDVQGTAELHRAEALPIVQVRRAIAWLQRLPSLWCRDYVDVKSFKGSRWSWKIALISRYLYRRWFARRCFASLGTAW